MSKRSWALVAIVFAYLSLGFLYSIFNPLFEAPDEHHHFTFIKYLVDNRSLPVQFQDAPRSEFHQPPLYYLLGALFTFWVETDDLPQRLERNPYWGYEIGMVGSDNKNQFLHGDEERFPYSGAVLAVHLVRLLSVALGAITVVATYLTAREIFPHRPALALGGLAFVAFNPQFIFMNSAVTNDSLVDCLASVTVLFMVRLVNRGLSASRVALLGATLGFSILAKVSALPLILIALLTIALATLPQRSWRLFLGFSLLLLVLVVIITGWWFVRNMVIYGEWFGFYRMWEVWGGRTPPAGWAQILADFPRVERSFWATFGWGNVPVYNTLYRALNIMVRLSILGFLVLTYRQLRGRVLDHRALLGLFILLSWVFAILVGLILFIRIDPDASGRYIFPGISAMAILLFLGLSAYLPSRFTQPLAWTANGGMFTFALVALFLYVIPAYARPPLLSGEGLSISHPLQITYGEKMRLLGYQVDKEKVKPGEALEVTLYWQSLAPMDINYSVFVHLYGRRGQLLGQRDSYPGLGNYPTRFWKPGDIIRDTYRVPILKEGWAPTRVSLEVGLYDLNTMERLPAFDREMRSLSRPLIGQVKLAPRHPVQYSISRPLHFHLGEKVALIGYEVEETVSPGEAVHLTLYWEALREMEENYTVFVHLIDGEGQIWAQKDNQPLENDYPTSLWERGEIMKDEYELRLGTEVPEGVYQLEVGMYLLETMARLPVVGEDGKAVGDRALLGPIQVTP